jgi:hypothetical protein
VVVDVITADDAGNGLGQRTVEEGIVLILEEAVALHDLMRDHDVLGVTADPAVGIAGSVEGALVVHSGLNGELVADLVFILPLGTYGENFTAELVTDDGGIDGTVVGNALVSGALKNGLVGGHTNAVGNDTGEDLVLLHFGKLELLKTNVIGTVNTDGFGFHFMESPFFFFKRSNKLVISFCLSAFFAGSGVSVRVKTSPSLGLSEKNERGRDRARSSSSRQTTQSPSMRSTKIVIISLASLEKSRKIWYDISTIITVIPSVVNKVRKIVGRIRRRFYGKFDAKNQRTEKKP